MYAGNTAGCHKAVLQGEVSRLDCSSTEALQQCTTAAMQHSNTATLQHFIAAVITDKSSVNAGSTAALQHCSPASLLHYLSVAVITVSSEYLQHCSQLSNMRHSRQAFTQTELQHFCCGWDLAAILRGR